MFTGLSGHIRKGKARSAASNVSGSIGDARAAPGSRIQRVLGSWAVAERALSLHGRGENFLLLLPIREAGCVAR
jgi:hypothetical protein